MAELVEVLQYLLTLQFYQIQRQMLPSRQCFGITYSSKVSVASWFRFPSGWQMKKKNTLASNEHNEGRWEFYGWGNS